jgi:hypothetical protein
LSASTETELWMEDRCCLVLAVAEMWQNYRVPSVLRRGSFASESLVSDRD